MRALIGFSENTHFLYLLDRETGKYLRSSKLIENLDWSSGIDPKGRPIIVPGKDPTPEGNRICPGVRGATNWMSQSWNPATGLRSVVPYAAGTSVAKRFVGAFLGGALLMVEARLAQG